MTHINSPRFKEIIQDSADIMSTRGLDASEFFAILRKKIETIQQEYAKKVAGIISPEEEKRLIKSLGSKIEVLTLVDENDNPYRQKDGFWASEFRKDCTDYSRLPEAKERQIFGRIVLFVLEDTQGNIIVSRRSQCKSHPRMLELAGGHVTVGHGYLETCLKELEEELGFIPENLSENDRLFKFRRTDPSPKPGTFGKGNIVTVYKVKVPGGVSSLQYDTNEIEELITMSPESIVKLINERGQEKNQDLQFEQTHAYIYLEYIKRMYGIDVTRVQKGLSPFLQEIHTFSEKE